MKESILNIFNHKKIERIVFSPRLYYWYIRNNLFRKYRRGKKNPENIPQKYFNKTQLEIANLRYIENLSYSQIANRISKSKTAVSKHIKKIESIISLI